MRSSCDPHSAMCTKIWQRKLAEELCQAQMFRGGGGPRLALTPCGGVILHVWEFCQLTHPLQLILPDSLR